MWPADRLNSRRIQMSSVRHSVRGVIPGVPGDPNGADPVFHEVLSYLSSNQMFPGLTVVYRHSTGAFRASGAISFTSGGVGSGAHFPLVLRPVNAHFFHVAGSVSILMKRPPTTGRA